MTFLVHGYFSTEDVHGLYGFGRGLSGFRSVQIDVKGSQILAYAMPPEMMAYLLRISLIRLTNESFTDKRMSNDVSQLHQSQSVIVCCAATCIRQVTCELLLQSSGRNPTLFHLIVANE